MVPHLAVVGLVATRSVVCSRMLQAAADEGARSHLGKCKTRHRRRLFHHQTKAPAQSATDSRSLSPSSTIPVLTPQGPRTGGARSSRPIANGSRPLRRGMRTGIYLGSYLRFTLIVPVSDGSSMGSEKSRVRPGWTRPTPIDWAISSGSSVADQIVSPRSSY